MTVTRGTSNSNVRGSSYARRARRAWLITNYASDVPGLSRCYRCGHLLHNPDDLLLLTALGDGTFMLQGGDGEALFVKQLTVDRIIPGCNGGTYRRNNIRPACGGCNSETGGALAHRRTT